jgi:hypothetical protein
MMRSMHAAQHPLVVRQGMRPVGYGYGYGTVEETEAAYKKAFPNGLPCLYLGAKDVPNTDVNEPILSLAKSLVIWGYAKEADLAEGHKGNYDSNMKRVVEELQRKNNLDVDGVVGPDTWKKLGELGMSVKTVGAQKCPARYTGGGGAGAGGAGGKKQAVSGGSGGGGGSITDKAWFWPVAILVPTAAVIGGILFWPKKKSQ